jgi:hypothetical protein
VSIALVLALSLVAPAQEAAARPAVDVHVDARVELMTLVWRLAGAPEFQARGSRYDDEVEEWFGLAREHPVIPLAQGLRARHGIGYNAVADLAVHLTRPPELALRFPLEPFPERLDRRWQGADVEGFLVELRAFAEETQLTGFLAEHDELRRAAEERLGAEVERAGVTFWLAEFFGLAADTTFAAIPGLLVGGNNFGCSVRLPGGELELTPVIGVSSWDAQGLPTFGAGTAPLLAHEFSHAFANPVVDASWERFEPAMTVLWERSREPLARQAYPDARITTYETLVRASVVRFVLARDGEKAARAQADYDVARGFTWVPALAERLAEYEADRTAYPTLKAFVPRLVACLEAQR